MKNNNQGFTMVELIGVVIIMGVLLLLIIPGVSKLMEKFRNDYYEKLELTTNESGKDFFNDNKIYLPDGILESAYVNTSSLITLKYADSLLDYKGNSCELEEKEGEEPKSYTIVIYRGNGEYVYQTCIDCRKEEYITNKEGTYCDPAWLSNDNIGYDYGGTDDLYFYYGTSRDKIREKLIKSLNVVKYKTEEKKDEDVLDRIAIGEEGILPTNIDIINNKPELDPETNKKEYTMIYKGENDNKLNAVIYKHQYPKVTMETVDEKQYDSATWTNKDVIITLEANDDFFEKAGVTVEKYQMSINSGVWQDADCMTGTDPETKLKFCKISIKVENDNSLTKNYRFRLINSEGNISKETEIYTIKIDKIKPNLDVTNVTDTVIFGPNGELTQQAQFTLKVSETPSGIDYTEVCLDEDCQKFTETSAPLTFTKTLYYSNPGKISIKSLDIAGNEIPHGFTINSIQYCKITYNENGGNVDKDSDTVICGQSVTLPNATRSGYEFSGWYTSSSGGTKVGSTNNSYRVDSNTTLYAQWEQIVVEPQYCTIYYNGNGGNVDKSYEPVECGNYVTLTSATRSGYEFKGWYTSSSGGTKVGSTNEYYKVSYDIDVYAHWEGTSGGGGGVTPTIPPHTCNKKARSQDRVKKTVADMKKYFPEFNEYGHWCDDESTTTQPCYDSDPEFMYNLTCSICGYVWKGYYWCPIHSSDSKKDICDASKGNYSGCKK